MYRTQQFFPDILLPHDCEMVATVCRQVMASPEASGLAPDMTARLILNLFRRGLVDQQKLVLVGSHLAARATKSLRGPNMSGPALFGAF